MHSILQSNLSYCMIDGHAIFLDLERDRYYRLTPSREAQFLASADAESNLGVSLPEPAHSVLEMTLDPGKANAATTIKVLSITLSARRRLRNLALKDVLGAVLRCREASTPSCAESHVVDLTQRFLRARLRLPMEPSCLSDSIALATYLALHGEFAHIVFGVTDVPFSAHCWVQVGNLVLNDTVGNATAYAPIRVI